MTQFLIIVAVAFFYTFARGLWETFVKGRRDRHFWLRPACFVVLSGILSAISFLIFKLEPWRKAIVEARPNDYDLLSSMSFELVFLLCVLGAFSCVCGLIAVFFADYDELPFAD